MLIIPVKEGENIVNYIDWENLFKTVASDQVEVKS